jgi:plastocyanin
MGGIEKAARYQQRQPFAGRTRRGEEILHFVQDDNGRGAGLMSKLPIVLIALLTMFGGVAAVTVAIQSGVVLADDDCDSSGPGNPCDDRDDNDDDHGDHHDGEDERDTSAQTALAQPVGEREIRIVDERYVPNTITIQAGQSVTFVNADDDEHTATGPGFDTGTMLPGDSVTIAFDIPGTFDFVCQFHSEMRGSVVVQGTGTPVASPVASPVALTPIASPPSAGMGETVTVDIVDFAFAQPEITVRPGTTVTWTNTGVAPHTVSGLPTESGTIDPGQSFSFTFDEAGTFDYQCAFHPQMTGRVIVDPSAPSPS